MRNEARVVALSVACDVAFDFLADYRNDTRWRSELRSVELVSGAPGEPGTVYRASVDWNGMFAPHEVEYTACERPRLIEMCSDIPHMRVDVRYVFTPASDGDGSCSLTADYRLTMEGPLRPLEPFGWAMLMGWVGDDLPKLRQVLSG